VLRGVSRVYRSCVSVIAIWKCLPILKRFRTLRASSPGRSCSLQRFGLPDTAPVVSCYEADREGFWLHRFLQGQGMTNYVVDSSSIEVNRRTHRAKSDGLDVRKLVRLRMRYAQGEREVWRVVPVPAVAAEDRRHLPRALETLQQERASTTTRIKGLLSSQGVRLTSLSKFPGQLEALRLWDSSPIPSGLHQRLLRVYTHHEFLSQQIAELAAERHALLPQLAGRLNRAGASADAPQRHRDQWGVVIGDGVFCLE
jgi:transposase